jgi:prepilin-type N-terminal cleavage/methylation domain-containing protein
MIRKAFTLIELLVVIAIIAILAAILFPVFAQAKVAAKGAAALSDVKQQTLAIIMYAGDADDYNVISTAWNTGNDPLTYGAGLGFSTWTWLVNPYEKNQDLDVDPLGPACPVPGGWPKILAESFNPTFGYNYDALAPYDGPAVNGAIGTSKPLSSTAVEFPANTVEMSAKWSTNGEWVYGNGGNTGLGFDFVANADNGPCLNTTMDPPNCDTIASYCIGNWGTGQQWSGLLAPGGPIAGQNSGGNSIRGIGAEEVTFCDGHAKKLTPANLAAGTNWNPNLNGNSLVINNLSKYLWYAIPETGN